jgi:hypothetical protein
LTDAVCKPIGLPDVGLPYLPPASQAVEDILTSGDLGSRGVLFVCEDIEPADLMAAAVARAWLCDTDPLGCGSCLNCRGEFFEKSPLVNIAPGRADAGTMMEVMAPFDERDVWCMVIHDASRMTDDAAGFLVLSLVEGSIEPGGLVVLTAPSVESVPEPVRSRCIRFDLSGALLASPGAEEWTTERTRAEEFEALGFCLSGDVFGEHRSAIEKLSLAPIDNLVLSWEEAFENGTADEGHVHLIAGIILRAERACERACGYLKLRTIDDHEIEILPTDTLPHRERELLGIGSCVALRVTFAPGLKRWWGTPTVGIIREAAPVATSRAGSTPC